MRRALLFLLWIFLATRATAQNAFPPAYEITIDTAARDTLPRTYWQILEDKAGKLRLKDVTQSPTADSFHYNLSEKIDRGVATYWFRFLLKNVTGHAVNIGFYDDYPGSSDWYFIMPDATILHKKNGFETPWSKKNDLKLINFVSVIIKAGGVLTIYERAHYDYFSFAWLGTTSPQSVHIEYGFTNKVIETSYILDESDRFQSVHGSFLFGLMLLAAGFNFFFFLIARERMYLYFALYVFFLGFGRFITDGDNFFHVFLREQPWIYAYLDDFYWWTIDFFLALFIRSLLQIRTHYPSWDKVLVSFTLLLFGAYISSLFISYYNVGTEKSGMGLWIFMASVILLHLSLLASFFLLLRRESRLKRWLLIAILPSFTVWAIGADTHHLSGLLYYSSHFQPSRFTNWLDRSWALIETICLCWQVLWFSWFLLHRFIELRRQVVQKELEKETERRELIEQQKTDLEHKVTERTAELKLSLDNLKSTQAQLIQSEKMASLGELTAGIAHEIQNPLNFVNNFSEVNQEMLNEMKDEIRKGNYAEADVIASKLVDNEEKIVAHGRRADAIVKSMLQHSRVSSGKREPIDINALCDEYVRLAYHGLRAKDKSFNAKFETDFDKTIGKVNIVPQDIGRVVLNLINNAFYAVNEKAKQNIPCYEPCVAVSTRKLNDSVEVRVKDNGNGIPERLRDKIFQPFFTTKPAGQGTGLGLSLGYDIIKAHSGEIRVESKEGEGSEFIIQLPTQA